MARLFKRKDDEEEKKRQQQEAEEVSPSSSAKIQPGDSGAADMVKHLMNGPASKKKWKHDTPPAAEAAPAPTPVEEPVIPNAKKPQKFGEVKTGKHTYDFSWADAWSDQQRMAARIDMAHDPDMLAAYDDYITGKGYVQDFQREEGEWEAIGRLKKRGLVDYTGKQYDLLHTDFSGLLNAVRMIPDTITRKAAYADLKKLTQVKGGRFEAYTLAGSDPGYLNTADMPEGDYDKFVKDVSGMFYRAGGYEKQNAEAYLEKYDEITGELSGLTDIQKHWYKKALDAAYREQTGLYPDVYEARKLAEGEKTEARISKPDDKPGLIEQVLEWGKDLLGIGEENTEPQGPVQQATTTPVSAPEPTPEPSVTPELPTAPEVQGPVQQEATEPDPLTLDEQMAARAAEKPEEPAKEQPAAGSVHLADDMSSAIEYARMGRYEQLDAATQTELQRFYDEAGPGTRIALGELAPELYREYQTGNTPADYLYIQNAGILGSTLAQYVLQVGGEDFPAELFGDAAMEIARIATAAEHDPTITPEDLQMDNRYELYLRNHPEELAGLEHVFDQLAGMRADAEANDVKLQELKAQELENARYAVSIGQANAQQKAIVLENAPDMDSVMAYRDRTYAEMAQELNEWFMDSSGNWGEDTGGWFNSTVYKMMRARGVKDLEDSESEYELLLNNTMESLLMQDMRMAASVGQDLETYYKKQGGMNLELLAQRASADILKMGEETSEEELTLFSQSVAEESEKVGLGVKSTVELTVMSGAGRVKEDALETVIMAASATDTPRDVARITTDYNKLYGPFYGPTVCAKQQRAFAESGKLPEKLSKAIIAYLDNGGSPYQLGIDPRDLGGTINAYAETRDRVAYCRQMVDAYATEGEAKFFKLGSGTVYNGILMTAAAIGSAVLGPAAGRAAPFLAMRGTYGIATQGGYMQDFMSKGYTLKESLALSEAKVSSDALANMVSLGHLSGQLAGYSAWLNKGLTKLGGAKNPSVVRTFYESAKRFAVPLAKDLAEEVVKDPILEGVIGETATSAVATVIDDQREGKDIGLGTAVRAAVTGVLAGVESVPGTIEATIEDAPNAFVASLPIAILGAGGEYLKRSGSYKAAQNLMNHPSAAAAAQFSEALTKDAQDARWVDAIRADEKQAEIEQTAAANLVFSPEPTLYNKAQKTREQANSHKAALEASTAANQQAVDTIVEMQEKLDAGDVDPQTVVELNNAQEAFAKSRHNMDESTREYTQKSTEARQAEHDLIQDAHDKAVLEVGRKHAAAAQQVQEVQVAVERQREHGNVAAMDAEAFIEERHPDATEEQKEEIRAAFAASSVPQSAEDARNVVNFATRVSDRFGVEVRFVDSLDGANSKYESGVIYITKDAAQSDVIRTVMTHELTHRAESSEYYKQLFEAAMEIVREKGSLEADLDSIRKTYAPRYEKEGRTFTETDAEQELVAQVCEQLIGGDEAMIERIVGKKPSLAARIADSIKRFIERMRGVKDPEIDRLRKVERLFRKALDSATAAEGDARYSISDKNPMTKKDFALFYEKVGEIQQGKEAQFARSADGQYILAVGNKLVYTDGDYKKPKISSVVEITLDDETDIDSVRRVIYESEEGRYNDELARRILESVYGKEVFVRYDYGVRGTAELGARGKAGEAGRTADRGNRKGKYSLPSGDLLKQEIAAWRSERSSDLEARNKLSDTGSEATTHGDGGRQFATKTAQQSQAMPDWLKQELLGNPEQRFYDRDTNAEQILRAWDRIQREGYDSVRDQLLNTENFTTEDNAAANVIMAMAFRDGDVNTALEIAHRYNTEGTKQGQALQSRNIFKRMTPTGIRSWAAGKAEQALADHMREHRGQRRRIDAHAEKVAEKIKGKRGGDEALRLLAAGDFAINSSNNKWGTPINEQQQALIDEYGLNKVRRPGVFYNRATTQQRMLEAILATPNPLELTGNGLNLIQRLEYLRDGEAVITNADLNYIGQNLATYAASDADAQQGREGDLALSRAYEAYGNITPASIREKARTWRYTSMLMSIPSAGRNVIGNSGQNLLNAVADGIATELDRLISLSTGERTRAHLSLSDRVNGWYGFVEETNNTFRDFFVDKSVTAKGEDRYNLNQRGRVFQSAAPETMRLIEGYLMSVGDRNFWRKKYLNSMAEQQRVAEINGVELDYDAAVERAEAEANYATFSEDSAVRSLFSQAKQIPVVGDVLDFIIPFTGVPTNIVKRMWQFSPAGLASSAINHAYRGLSGQDFDQRSFVDSMARGLTGTALFAIGMALASEGLIELGTGEEDDTKVYGVKTAQGGQYSPYIRVGDEYVSLSPFAPAASAIIMGATADQLFKENADTWQALYNASLAGLDQIFDASYMSSLQDIFQGYGSTAENIGTTILNSVVSQNVPAVLGQLATAMDPYARDTKDKNAIVQALKTGLIAKIPGLREMLPEKVDVTGKSVVSKEGLRNFFDPTYTTAAADDPALDEMMRLYEATQDSSFMPLDMLSGKKNTLTVNGTKYTLTGKQKEAYKKRYGELWHDEVSKLVSSPAYQRMSDEKKAERIRKIVKAARTKASREMALKFGQ